MVWLVAHDRMFGKDRARPRIRRFCAAMQGHSVRKIDAMMTLSPIGGPRAEGWLPED